MPASTALQVLVAGSGLVLQTPDGEIDVRTPFKPVRFAGETPIVSRLEAGPVEVVNLIGDRAKVRIDLQVLHAGAATRPSAPGTHLAYAADGPAALDIDGTPHRLAADHALRIEVSGPTMIACDRRRAFAGERHMRIAVVGAGGVGGGFGAALAKAGADVTFIARGAHLAAMKSKGLKIEGGRGDTHLVPTQATDDPRTVGPVDFVLFCVKLWDVESAGEHIKPLVGPEHRGDPAAERHRRARTAAADPRPAGRDGRRGADQRLDRRARRDPPDRHLHAHAVRRARRQPQPARRGAARDVQQGRLRRAC